MRGRRQWMFAESDWQIMFLALLIGRIEWGVRASALRCCQFVATNISRATQNHFIRFARRCTFDFHAL